MIFSIIILGLVGGIAYFHYAQGFFSATMSAVIAVVAAVLAVSYHETLVLALLKGKFADYAIGMGLIAIFALLYIVLRTIFDKAVPGNIRLPVIVDRVGGAVMGLIAGIFAAGVFALAAQSLPFGPSIAGYSRYALENDREVTVIPSGQSRAQDMTVVDQLKEDRFEPASKSGLLIPVDNILLSAVEKLSDGGSLAGDQKLSAVHPDYADELFAQRLGIQVGAKRSALELPGQEHVSVPAPGVFHPEQDLTKAQIDGEIGQMHQRPVIVKPERGQDYPLVVRVMFGKDATDTDGLVRFSPGSVRLVANGHNYWPVGTVENAKLLYANKLDDYLIVQTKAKDAGADMLFYIDPADAVEGDPKARDQKIKDGVFIEVKRLARIDLSGRPVRSGIPASADVAVLRKPGVSKEAPAGVTGAGAGAAPTPAAAANAPFVFSKVEISNKLFSPINTGTGEKDVKNATIPSGTVSLRSRQFTQLDINTTQTLRLMQEGSFTVDELFEPTGKKLVQIVGTPPPEGGDAWTWAENLSKFALVDAAGKKHKPAGAWAKIKKEQSDRMVAKYNISGAAADLGRDEGRPTDVWIAFLVPSGTHLKQLMYEGKPLATMEEVVP